MKKLTSCEIPVQEITSLPVTRQKLSSEGMTKQQQHSAAYCPLDSSWMELVLLFRILETVQ